MSFSKKNFFILFLLITLITSIRVYANDSTVSSITNNSDQDWKALFIMIKGHIAPNSECTENTLCTITKHSIMFVIYETDHYKELSGGVKLIDYREHSKGFNIDYYSVWHPNSPLLTPLDSECDKDISINIPDLTGGIVINNPYLCK